MINKLHAIAAIAVCALSAPAFADPVKVVAAENFYGDMASQIGGANVAVTSILSNPDDDPHLFEASPATAKALSASTASITTLGWKSSSALTRRLAERKSWSACWSTANQATTRICGTIRLI
jgi:hypothetical protein